MASLPEQGERTKTGEPDAAHTFAAEEWVALGLDLMKHKRQCLSHEGSGKHKANAVSWRLWEYKAKVVP